jgi:hypothetical protein
LLLLDRPSLYRGGSLARRQFVNPLAILRLRDIPCKLVGKFLPSYRASAATAKKQTFVKLDEPADKIKLVFNLGYAILMLRIDEWKIHPVRVTEILLLHVSTLFSGTKKAAKDLPLLV